METCHRSCARGRTCTRIGVRLVDKDTYVVPPHLLLVGDPSWNVEQVSIRNTGAARMDCHLRHSDSLTAPTLHP
jgi:hypothetical protein